VPALQQFNQGATHITAGLFFATKIATFNAIQALSRLPLEQEKVK